jgi:hypothetical protein
MSSKEPRHPGATRRLAKFAPPTANRANAAHASRAQKHAQNLARNHDLTRGLTSAEAEPIMIVADGSAGRPL